MHKKFILAVTIVAALVATPAWAALECSSSGVLSGGSGTCAAVTERLPGMKCSDATPDSIKKGAPVYYCPAGQGFSGFFDVLRGLMRYGIVIALLFGVLMIVVAGIRISASGAAEGLGLGDQRTDAKMMLLKVVSGIVALALVGVILNTVAPWVFTG